MWIRLKNESNFVPETAVAAFEACENDQLRLLSTSTIYVTLLSKPIYDTEVRSKITNLTPFGLTVDHFICMQSTAYKPDCMIFILSVGKFFNI